MPFGELQFPDKIMENIMDIWFFFTGQIDITNIYFHLKLSLAYNYSNSFGILKIEREII